MHADHDAVTPAALRALTNHELEQAVADLSAQIDEASHRLLTLIRELDRRGRHADHGLASMAQWLGWRVGLGPVAAREKVRVAKALGELPKIDAALARAEVSYSKVRAMTRIATPDNEERLLHTARNATAAQLERICRGVEQLTRTSDAGVERWLRCRADSDGMVRLEARLHADEAALVMKAIEAAREVPAEVCASHDDAKEARQRDNVDALVQVAESYLAGQRAEARPGGERHQLLVCVKADELAPGGVMAELSPTGAEVPPETLRRMACDASVCEVTVDREGRPLDVGRKTRTVPPAIRRALHVRDGGCRFPGCGHRRWLDAHHVQHWADGGATSQDNLLLLCARHHTLVHEGGFRLERIDGELVFKRPDGSLMTAPPPRVTPLGRRARAPRPPTDSRPDFNLAIGLLLPRRAA